MSAKIKTLIRTKKPTNRETRLSINAFLRALKPLCGSGVVTICFQGLNNVFNSVPSEKNADHWLR